MEKYRIVVERLEKKPPVELWRIERALFDALSEIYTWHARVTEPIEAMKPDALRGQVWRNVLDLLRPAHVVRQQILAGRRLEPDELSTRLPPADWLESRVVWLGYEPGSFEFDWKRVRDALEVAERERMNVRYARAIAERHGVPEDEPLMRYIRDQEEFFDRVIEAARRLLRSRQNRV